LILPLGLGDNGCDAFTGCSWLPLIVDYRRVDVVLIPLSWKQLFPVFVDCRGHHALDDAQIVSDGCGSEVWRHILNQLFQGAIVDVN
jgi:hypothetical protein